MTDLTRALVEIALSPFPANPKKYAWVSAVEEGPYHIETIASAANGGQGFRALCGAFGDFNCHLTAGRIFPSQKCKTCVDLAAKGIQEVADQGRGTAPFTESITVGDTGAVTEARVPPLPLKSGNGAGFSVKPPCPETIFLEGGDGYRADDRFADNISRFVDRELAEVGQ